jgi:ethanolamine ammonia-lyase small subunit
MNFTRLRDFTPARVGLGRAGSSVPTHELLAFQLAHAHARDAVHARLDSQALVLELSPRKCLMVRSAAPDRSTYLRRPDLGRRLSEESIRVLSAERGTFDSAFVIADGLSALAVARHGSRMLESILKRLAGLPWTIAPIAIVEQGRVAIGDEVAASLGASLAVVLIGERPGLSSPDSLGIYLTWNPRPGVTDADRNCISNIWAEGLSYEAAAHRLLFLMTEARSRKRSGVELRENASDLQIQGSRVTLLGQ